MALDFYEVSDKAQKEILFSLNDSDMGVLEPVFKELRRLTGISIDQYGKSRISQGHLELIGKLIADLLNTSTNNTPQLQKFRDLFQNVYSDVIAIGD